MCFFLRVVIINTKSAVVWVWPLQSLYSSERDLNKQTLLLPALPRIKWERLWCIRGSFTYRPSSVSPLVHAHTHSRTHAHNCHTDLDFLRSPCVCVLLEGPSCSLCWKSCLFSLFTQTSRQTQGWTDRGRDGRTDRHKVSLLCGSSLQGFTRAGSPTFLLCPCSLHNVHD